MARSSDSDNAFRRFCLAVYPAPGAEEACLVLQDGYGFDVTMALLCAWVGRFGVRLPTETLRRADRAIGPFRETAVMPLRDLRRRLKDDVGGIGPADSAPVRDLVKQAELAAEYVVIDRLCLMMDRLPGTDARDADRAGLIRGNLLRYGAMLGHEAASLPRETLECLVSAATETPIPPPEGAYDPEDPP